MPYVKPDHEEVNSTDSTETTVVRLNLKATPDVCSESSEETFFVIYQFFLFQSKQSLSGIKKIKEHTFFFLFTGEITYSM